MKWAILYADLIGGVLGIFGSIVLAIPMILEIDDRKHWQGYADFLQGYSRMRAGQALTPEEQSAERNVRDWMLNERLGNYRRHRRITIAGVALLIAAFLFMTVATGMRIWGE
jgi:hypothetical protein